MQLEKSNIGYRLIKPENFRYKADNNQPLIDDYSAKIEYLQGLLKRLRNMLISLFDLEYCRIEMLPCEGYDDEITDGAQDDRELEKDYYIVPVAYKDALIGQIKYLYSNEDNKESLGKIEMMADLAGYLIYYFLESCGVKIISEPLDDSNKVID